MSEPVIQVHRLTRYFGSRAVVREMNMIVPQGQVTALLGLNGAGKTTTLEIILGLLRPTRGHSEVLGENSQAMSPATRMRIGYMVEGHFLYPGMRIQECERFQRGGYTRWDDSLFDDIMSHFGIRSSSRISELSRGQRAGVALALVLAPDPELLVLDDPVLGLDPVSRRALNETLVEFAGRAQRSVLLSTHLLDDVERIADRVMVMVDGRLHVDTTLDDFRERVTAFDLRFADSIPPHVASIPGLVEARKIGDRLQLIVANADDSTRAALEDLKATSMEPAELTFGDAVLGYLAPHRRDASFFTERPRDREFSGEAS